MKHILVEMEKLKNLNSGLGQFCFHIGRAFQKLSDNDLKIDFYLSEKQKNLFGENFGYVEQKTFHKIIPISSKEYDIWHCTHQDSHFLPRNRNTKLILTIHDLNFLEKYKGAKREIRMKLLQKKVNKAAAITVISKYTEKIVRANLKLGDKPLHVIYNGNSLSKNEKGEKPVFIKFEKFIFSIGAFLSKKNFRVLFSLLKQDEDLHLVLVGDKINKHAFELLEIAKENKVIDRLVLSRSVTENEKYWLYKNCKAFVFPSLSEGFGLSVVEAMSMGKPVFLSDRTSLPEIGGKEAYYWENFEPDHMTEVFRKGMHDFESDKEKSQRIINWANKFSWETAAKAYLELYRSL